MNKWWRKYIHHKSIAQFFSSSFSFSVQVSIYHNSSMKRRKFPQIPWFFFNADVWCFGAFPRWKRKEINGNRSLGGRSTSIDYFKGLLVWLISLVKVIFGVVFHLDRISLLYKLFLIQKLKLLWHFSKFKISVKLLVNKAEIISQF